ncbi:MAG: hypothetical protein ACE5HY_00870 [Candidatus Hydrothermarchaeales archaeon]
MRDFPSILLRLVGVILIALGLSGIALGAYTFKVVYDYNLGSPRGDIKETITDITNTQRKLEEDKKEIESAMDKTAQNLEDSGEAAVDAGNKLDSPDLKDMGRGLYKASKSIQLLNSAFKDTITDVSRPLDDTAENLELVVEMASNIKAIAYALILYLIFVHLVILGIGIALIVIEANLFYP